MIRGRPYAYSPSTIVATDTWRPSYRSYFVWTIIVSVVLAIVLCVTFVQNRKEASSTLLFETEDPTVHVNEDEDLPQEFTPQSEVQLFFPERRQQLITNAGVLHRGGDAVVFDDDAFRISSTNTLHTRELNITDTLAVGGVFAFQNSQNGEIQCTPGSNLLSLTPSSSPSANPQAMETFLLDSTRLQRVQVYGSDLQTILEQGGYNIDVIPCPGKSSGSPIWITWPRGLHTHIHLRVFTDQPLHFQCSPTEEYTPYNSRYTFTLEGQQHARVQWIGSNPFRYTLHWQDCRQVRLTHDVSHVRLRQVTHVQFGPNVQNLYDISCESCTLQFPETHTLTWHDSRISSCVWTARGPTVMHRFIDCLLTHNEMEETIVFTSSSSSSSSEHPLPLLGSTAEIISTTTTTIDPVLEILRLEDLLQASLSNAWMTVVHDERSWMLVKRNDGTYWSRVLSWPHRQRPQLLGDSWTLVPLTTNPGRLGWHRAFGQLWFAYVDESLSVRVDGKSGEIQFLETATRTPLGTVRLLSDEWLLRRPDAAPHELWLESLSHTSYSYLWRSTLESSYDAWHLIPCLDTNVCWIVDVHTSVHVICHWIPLESRSGRAKDDSVLVLTATAVDVVHVSTRGSDGVVLVTSSGEGWWIYRDPLNRELREQRLVTLHPSVGTLDAVTWDERDQSYHWLTTLVSTTKHACFQTVMSEMEVTISTATELLQFTTSVSTGVVGASPGTSEYVLSPTYGSWVSTVLYDPGQRVIYNGTLYVAVQASTNQSPDVSFSSWHILVEGYLYNSETVLEPVVSGTVRRVQPHNDNGWSPVYLHTHSDHYLQYTETLQVVSGVAPMVWFTVDNVTFSPFPQTTALPLHDHYRVERIERDALPSPLYLYVYDNTHVWEVTLLRVDAYASVWPSVSTGFSATVILRRLSYATADTYVTRRGHSHVSWDGARNEATEWRWHVRRVPLPVSSSSLVEVLWQEVENSSHPWPSRYVSALEEEFGRLQSGEFVHTQWSLQQLRPSLRPHIFPSVPTFDNVTSVRPYDTVVWYSGSPTSRRWLNATPTQLLATADGGLATTWISSRPFLCTAGDHRQVIKPWWTTTFEVCDYLLLLSGDQPLVTDLGPEQERYVPLASDATELNGGDGFLLVFPDHEAYATWAWEPQYDRNVLQLTTHEKSAAIFTTNTERTQLRYHNQPVVLENIDGNRWCITLGDSEDTELERYIVLRPPSLQVDEVVSWSQPLGEEKEVWIGISSSEEFEWRLFIDQSYDLRAGMRTPFVSGEPLTLWLDDVPWSQTPVFFDSEGVLTSRHYLDSETFVLPRYFQVKVHSTSSTRHSLLYQLHGRSNYSSSVLLQTHMVAEGISVACGRVKSASSKSSFHVNARGTVTTSGAQCHARLLDKVPRTTSTFLHRLTEEIQPFLPEGTSLVTVNHASLNASSGSERWKSMIEDPESAPAFVNRVAANLRGRLLAGVIDHREMTVSTLARFHSYLTAATHFPFALHASTDHNRATTYDVDGYHDVRMGVFEEMCDASRSAAHAVNTIARLLGSWCQERRTEALWFHVDTTSTQSRYFPRSVARGLRYTFPLESDVRIETMITEKRARENNSVQLELRFLPTTHEFINEVWDDRWSVFTTHEVCLVLAWDYPQRHLASQYIYNTLLQPLEAMSVLPLWLTSREVYATYVMVNRFPTLHSWNTVEWSRYSDWSHLAPVSMPEARRVLSRLQLRRPIHSESSILNIEEPIWWIRRYLTEFSTHTASEILQVNDQTPLENWLPYFNGATLYKWLHILNGEASLGRWIETHSLPRVRIQHPLTLPELPYAVNGWYPRMRHDYEREWYLADEDSARVFTSISRHHYPLNAAAVYFTSASLWVSYFESESEGNSNLEVIVKE